MQTKNTESEARRLMLTMKKNKESGENITREKGRLKRKKNDD